MTVLDDLSTGSEENLPPHPALRLVRGSVTDPTAVRAAGPADLVVHLAGVVGMRLAVRVRERAYQVAEVGTRTVLAETGAAPVLLFSSSAVYGGAGEEPMSERRPVRADDLRRYDGGAPGYASGKWRLEELGRAAACGGRPVLIVRPFNVVGPGQSAAYGMVIPTFVRRALAGLALEVYDDGQQTRCFSEVRCFTRLVARLLHDGRSWRHPALTLNLGSTVQSSVGEVARVVLEETGSTAGTRHVPYGEVFPGRQDVRSRAPDIRRALALLGRAEWPELRTIVRDVVASLRRSADG